MRGDELSTYLLRLLGITTILTYPAVTAAQNQAAQHPGPPTQTRVEEQRFYPAPVNPGTTGYSPYPQPPGAYAPPVTPYYPPPLPYYPPPGAYYPPPGGYYPPPGAYYGSTTYRQEPQGPYQYWRRPGWDFTRPRPGSSVASDATTSPVIFRCREDDEDCKRVQPPPKAHRP